jgi:HSP20 family protein
MAIFPTLDALESAQTKEDILEAIGDLTELDFHSVPSGPFLPCDVLEWTTMYQIHCDAPGIEKGDISLTLKGDDLTLSAKRDTLAKKEGVIYRRSQLPVGEVSRTITLPEDCQKEKIVAENKNGVLVITIPRKQETEEAVETIHIEIK